MQIVDRKMKKSQTIRQDHAFPFLKKMHIPACFAMHVAHETQDPPVL